MLVCIVNLGILRGRSGEIVKMLERKSVNICSEKENRFRIKSVWMINEKASQYELYWIGNKNTGTRIHHHIVRKWTLNHLAKLSCVVSTYLYDALTIFYYVTYAIRVNLYFVTTWMSRIPLLQASVISEIWDISNPQPLFQSCQKNRGEGNCSYSRGLNGHIGNNTEDIEEELGGYSYKVTNKERKMEFYVAMSKTVGSTLFKKRASH